MLRSSRLLISLITTAIAASCTGIITGNDELGADDPTLVEPDAGAEADSAASAEVDGGASPDDLPPGPDAAPPGLPDGGTQVLDAAPPGLPPSSEVVAFPGAEGFGAAATGGRGGQVLKVTTLAASGPGSLQAALDTPGPRIIVFDVSGVIDGDIHIPYGDVTIAGQTAPGGGITIRGRLIAAYNSSVGNFIIRHIRVRPAYDGSSGEQFDSIQISLNRLVILDHVSVAFGVDETVDMYSARDVTLQWSSIESSATSGHPEGEHNYGFINGPDGVRVSIHHTLFVHHKNRCPAVANGPADIRNNVAYNVRHGFVHHNPASGPFNITGNTFRDGPDDVLIPFWFDDEELSSSTAPSYWMVDNTIDDPTSSCNGRVDNPWEECSYDMYLDESHRATAEHEFSYIDGYVPVTTRSSPDAYAVVLASAGAFPRDVITEQCVLDVLERGGAWGATMPADLMQGLTPGSPPADNDSDGMANAWEVAHGLDPDDPADSTTITASGYTAIEDYINERADAITP